MIRNTLLHLSPLMSAAQNAFVWQEHIGKIVTTALLSMVPTFEGRYAVAVALGMGMPIGFAYLLALISSSIPMPVILLLLRPVLGADLEHLELDFDHYQAAVEERQEELADTQTEAMASIIAEQTEAYILDKAGELGLEVTVRVETRTEGNGIPVPWSAELTGSWSQALASALETELGIPAERQVWHEREAEN